MRKMVVAVVALGVGRVAQEDARGRVRSKFMRGGRGDARIAEAPEDAKIVIGWGAPEKQVVWCKVAADAARPNVDEA